MPAVALVSDSTAGLSSEIVERYNVQVVPLYIKIGEDTYRDGVDLSPEEFYRILPTCSELPTTSQPSSGDLSATYHRAIDAGAASILSIHLSSGISGTINSARLAAQDLADVPVQIVDVQCAAASHKLVVEAAGHALQQGATLEQATAAAMQVVAQHRTLFTVDSLEYLHKGGRIGGASALVGSLLQFKPLLHFVDGQITALERVRKTSRSLSRIAELMLEEFGPDEPLRSVIMQAECLETAQRMSQILGSQVNVVHEEIVYLTPVIGAHVGNGTLGVCCCPNRLLEAML